MGKRLEFSDQETWSLDVTFAKFAAPRIRRLAEISNGYPPDLTMKKWRAVLGKMARAFEILGRDVSIDAAQFKHVNEGLDLFRQYYRNLWW